MHRKAVATVAALGLATVGVAPALAAHKSAAPTKLTISTSPASQSYKVNRYAQFALRWSKDTYTIKSGGTVTFKNRQSDDPHTFSVLKASQMPRTTKALNACGTEPPAAPKYPPCRALFQAHAPDAQGNPQNPVVNVGNAGIDRPGDSLFIAPKGAGPQQTIKVTAKKGTTLHFICLVHPWMQATLLVR